MRMKAARFPVFAFHNQDVLKIVEEGISVIQYNDFYVVNCMM